MKQAVRNLVLNGKWLLYSFQHPSKQKKIIEDVPYFSQWESPELVSKILDKEIPATDDPKWKQSGAKRKIDYLNWSWSGCALACLRMALVKIKGQNIPLVTLGEASLKYDTYVRNDKDYESGKYLSSLSGMLYKPFLRFIKAEFGIQAKMNTIMVIPEIVDAIESDNLVIASIQGPKGVTGHLVLVVGYDDDNKSLYIQDPAGRTPEDQKYSPISYTDFEKRFNHRGILLKIN